MTLRSAGSFQAVTTTGVAPRLHPVAPRLDYGARTVLWAPAVSFQRSGVTVPTITYHHGIVQWLHYAEGSAMLPVMLTLYVSRLGEAGKPLHPRLHSEVWNHFGYISRSLEDREYLVEDRLTGADIQMVFVIESASKMGIMDDFENLKEYVERMQSRPAFRRALERSGEV